MNRQRYNDGATVGRALIGLTASAPQDADLEDPDFCDGLASVAFNCDGCGRWHGIEKEVLVQDGEQFCTDCAC